MKVLITESFATSLTQVVKGEVADIPDSIADAWIADGLAMPVDERVVETATQNKIVETAVTRKRK